MFVTEGHVFVTNLCHLMAYYKELFSLCNFRVLTNLILN